MKITPDKDDFWMLPLGGCGLFGANLTLYGHDGWWIMVDCGTAFVEERHLGIDMMLPDMSFIEERKEKLAAIIITHAHEDHIGALPYLWPRLKVPVFATPFAAEVIKRKCSEFEDARNINLKPLPTQTPIRLQGFEINALPLCHSIAEPRALHIKTAAGAILHTGDWNNDPSPVIGLRTEASTFSDLGPLLAVVGDSTNAMTPGKGGTEATMQPAFEQVFAGAKGRVAVTMFSSNIGRIISIAKAAQKCKRHVAVVGRSLKSMVEAAKTTGYMDDCPPLLSDKDAAEMPGNKMVYLVAGSQGEPNSSLSRIARDDHSFITLGQGDVACFSARSIPGNEKKINEVINNLIGRGVQVVTANDAPIHVSGHAFADDIKEFLHWTKPDAVMAVHGELMQQTAHAELARGEGVKHAITPQNGELWSLAEGAPKKITEVPHGFLYIENSRILDPDHGAIAERKKMGYNGAVFITVQGHDVIISPLGLMDENDEDDQQLLDTLHDHLRVLIKGHKGSEGHLAEAIRTTTRRFFDTELGYRPVTIVHVAD